MLPADQHQMVAQWSLQEVRDCAARELDFDLCATEILLLAGFCNRALGKPKLLQLPPANAQERDGAGREFTLNAHAQPGFEVRAQAVVLHQLPGTVQ